MLPLSMDKERTSRILNDAAQLRYMIAAGICIESEGFPPALAMWHWRLLCTCTRGAELGAKRGLST